MSQFSHAVRAFQVTCQSLKVVAPSQAADGGVADCAPRSRTKDKLAWLALATVLVGALPSTRRLVARAGHDREEMGDR
jgi:hypothetical protein